MKGLLYLSIAVVAISLALPLFGAKASPQEVLPVALSAAVLAISLTIFLARRGELKLWTPSMRVTFRVVGLLVLLCGAGVAVLAEMPISERQNAAARQAARLQESRAKLQGPVSPQERAKLEQLIEIDDDGGYMAQQAELYRFYQKLAAAVGGVGLLVIGLSWFVPRPEADLGEPGHE